MNNYFFNSLSANNSANNLINTTSNMRRLVISFCLIALLGGLSACSNKNSQNKELLAQEQVETLYRKGKESMEKGNYAFAINYFRALEANFPYGAYTEQAKLDIIFALDKSGLADRAVDAADNFIKLYPTHRNVDYAYFMKGVASFEKKQSRLDKFITGKQRSIRDPEPYRKSMRAFEDLLKRFPNSKYADDARQRLVFIRNNLANRELGIAQYYFDNETYVAAVTRCKTIIYQYETSPAVEHALVLMEKAYLEMGLEDLAASTHDVLVTNFPDYANQQFKPKKKSVFGRLNPFKR